MNPPRLRKHDQIRPDDCFSACLASILGFEEYKEGTMPVIDPNNAYEFWEGVKNFLEPRGLALVQTRYPEAWFPCGINSGCFIVSGQSPRRPHEEGYNHAVIYGEVNGILEMVHDPHTSRDGVIGRPLWAFFLWPRVELDSTDLNP